MAGASREAGVFVAAASTRLSSRDDEDVCCGDDGQVVAEARCRWPRRRAAALCGGSRASRISGEGGVEREPEEGEGCAGLLGVSWRGEGAQGGLEGARGVDVATVCSQVATTCFGARGGEEDPPYPFGLGWWAGLASPGAPGRVSFSFLLFLFFFFLLFVLASKNKYLAIL